MTPRAPPDADRLLPLTTLSNRGCRGLEFEGYSTKDATFAGNNVQGNWNEQAAKAAENYLDFQNFSRSGLIEQLEFEGYTTKQATYGADSVGL
ncbi:MAG: Ltp family lipoprotein [Micrococcales bacterium]|nr:Ltp family lipoprotein [Micrococcales bacterium]